jgi:hypothetical protein
MIILFIILNTLAFLLMGLDKYLAVKNKYRISEFTLLSIAIIGGALGTFLGMKIFCHKTMHGKFKYGLPVLIIFNIWILYFLYKF